MIKKILPPKMIYGRYYYPCDIAHLKKDADARAKAERAKGNLARVLPWPRDVSTEEYGERPGFWLEPKWVVYSRKITRTKA